MFDDNSVNAELSASGYVLILGLKFEEPVFMHAITHVQDL